MRTSHHSVQAKTATGEASFGLKLDPRAADRTIGVGAARDN